MVLVAEPAIPLAAWLAANKPRGGVSTPADRADFAAACVWGVYSLVTALSFLASCDLCHGNVTADAVFVTRGGDWKLGGFELCVDAGSADFPDRWFTDNDARGPCPEVAKAPERAERAWAAVAAGPRTGLDGYSLGVLLLEVFLAPASPPAGGVEGYATGGGLNSSGSPSGGALMLSSARGAGLGFLYSAADVKGALGRMGAPGSLLPPPLRPFVTRLLSSVPRSRPPPGELLACEYFRHPLVGALLFLDELALKEPADKARFFKSLPALLPRFPVAIAKWVGLRERRCCAGVNLTGFAVYLGVGIVLSGAMLFFFRGTGDPNDSMRICHDLPFSFSLQVPHPASSDERSGVRSCG